MRCEYCGQEEGVHTTDCITVQPVLLEWSKVKALRDMLRKDLCNRVGRDEEYDLLDYLDNKVAGW